MATKKEEKTETPENAELSEEIKIGESNPPRPDKKYRQEGDLLIPVENE